MRTTTLLLIFFTLMISALAASPPSFCKCTCFTNSTIIPLTPNAPTTPRQIEIRAASSTCAMCNRAFCLSQRLPFCKDAEEKDVFTTCFQRDSRKDQIVVLTFITSTLGLLGWAGIRKIIEKRKAIGGDRLRGDAQQGYIAVNEG
ncbi:hypothetical protein B7463_g8761, partial [Scytalidium lignicola]